jgi:hypothetical protein
VREMNERQKLEGAEGRLSDRNWVRSAVVLLRYTGRALAPGRLAHIGEIRRSAPAALPCGSTTLFEVRTVSIQVA